MRHSFGQFIFRCSPSKVLGLASAIVLGLAAFLAFFWLALSEISPTGRAKRIEAHIREKVLVSKQLHLNQNELVTLIQEAVMNVEPVALGDGRGGVFWCTITPSDVDPDVYVELKSAGFDRRLGTPDDFNWKFTLENEGAPVDSTLHGETP